MGWRPAARTSTRTSGSAGTGFMNEAYCGGVAKDSTTAAFMRNSSPSKLGYVSLGYRRWSFRFHGPRSAPRKDCTIKTPTHDSLTTLQASVRLEGFAGFDQGLEAGENAGPAVRGGGVGGIVFRPLIMQDGDLGGLGLRYEFDGDARGRGGRAHGEGVLQQLWRIRLEDFPVNVG